jgi:hypothetical protein
MPNKLTSVLVASLVGCALAPAVARPSQAPAAERQVSPAAPPTSLADVAFMTGHWRNDENGNLSEEVWTSPSGDSMQGMWRFVTGGKVKLFEALTLTREAGGVVMRLRHFDAALAAKEEMPFTLRLVFRDPGQAAFEGPGSSGPLRITYRRDGDVLTSTVESGGKREQYSFKKVSG